ncbi:hypothetical protein MJD09_04680 [bacterium]|nr:hypothetical protein [bacterium]
MLSALLARDPIRPILDGLGDGELVEAHQFVWNKLVEIHYLTQKREFIREEITKRMMPSATYQHQQKCDLRLDYCKGVECIWSNPICAGNKVKNNIEVMAQTIVGYLHSQNSKQLKTQHRQRRKEWL